MTHDEIWAFIDAAASRYRLSPSALARLCGFDNTAFNKCKRHYKFGQERWPSTKVFSRILEVLNISIVEMAEMMQEIQNKKNNNQ